MRTGRNLARQALALAMASQLAAESGAARAAPASDAAVARMVASFVEFTRWPERRGVVRLCIAGTADKAGALGPMRLSDGRPIERKVLQPAALANGQCDVAYFGTMPAASLRAATTALRGKGVLTIAENDPQCRSQAMFCLVYPASGVSFRLNIDAVSRSGLRVDPRVLRIGEGEAGQ